MQRDINKLRDLESGKDNNENYDIIRKKKIIENILKSDPDIKEVLGEKFEKPLNRYKDSKNPTDDELKQRKEIIDYNSKLKREQIVPWMKLNGIQQEVLNFIMYDIYDDDTVYKNSKLKYQYVTFMCLVHQDDMQTEYGITRADLLGYIIKDLFQWSNILGNKLECIYDRYEIVDMAYYSRTLKFRTTVPNGIFPTSNNRYDKFKI